MRRANADRIGRNVRVLLPAMLALALGAAGCEWGDVAPGRALRAGDQSNLVVVVPADAPDLLAMAAQDLSDVARMRTGAATGRDVVRADGGTFDPARAGAPLVVLAGVLPKDAAPLDRGDLSPDDARTSQGYVIAEAVHGDRRVLRVESPTAQGVAFGLYDLADRMGARWFHPEDAWVPVDPAAQLPGPFDPPVRSSPAVALRAYHQHTQHPVPMSDWLMDPPDDAKAHLSAYFRWLLRNRQNGFQWHMLSTVDLAAWRDHGRWVVDEAHRHGVRVGLSVAFADKQQNGFRLIADLGDALQGEARIAHQRTQLRQGLDAFWAMDLGIDWLNLLFATTEMTTVADAEVLAWFDEAADWAATVANPPTLWAHLHIPGKLYAEDGQTLFYHLPLRADPAVGLMVHTTMFYDLEHPAPVYGNADFTHAHVPFVQGRGERRLGFFPETAWWLGFDNSLPLLLPLTGWARGNDLGGVLPRLLDGVPLDAHVTFTTGIEWTYWMYDHFLARATWDPGFTWDAYVADAAGLYGDASGAAAEALRALTDTQRAAFFGNNPLIYFYLAGESANDELGAPSGLVGRPVKVPFWDVYHLDDAGFAAWQAGDFAQLGGLRDAFADAAADLAAADAGTPAEDATTPAADRFFELRSAAEVLAWRAEHALLLYGAVADARSGDEAAAYGNLGQARALTDTVRARVAQVEARCYRCPLDLCAAPKPDTPTAYPYGDLHETRTAHYWQRRDDQVQALLDVVFGKVPEGFDPGFATVWTTDATASEMLEPDVDEGMKTLLAAYVPALLLAAGTRTEAGLPLALGEDLNGNGRPDPGTVVAGLSPAGADPWVLHFAVLPLAIGDSANPLGTLNLRAGTATVTTEDGAPVRLEVAARVDFADLLDALVSTGMFDPQSAWEMVAPLFDIDPAAEPRPQDFPMRFAAPLLAVPTAG